MSKTFDRAEIRAAALAEMPRPSQHRALFLMLFEANRPVRIEDIFEACVNTNPGSMSRRQLQMRVGRAASVLNGRIAGFGWAAKPAMLLKGHYELRQTRA